ncbi:MAG: DNA polymerase III subunit beta [Candidatus Eisenbacteria sp.]|nr:DNA polymerase III subunit beta [Candidatus Eisenbacteria bacterium]
MKFTLMQGELQKALHVVASVVPSKSTLPILETVLIKAGSEGTLTLTATDLDISVRSQRSATVEQEGCVAISARRFFDVVRELPDQEVSLIGDEGYLQLSCGRGRYRFVGAPVDDFPELPELLGDKLVRVDPQKLERMIRRTLYAVSTDETRPELTGVFLEIDKGKLQMVATNGHRLAQAAIHGSFKHEKELLLPPKALNQLLRLIPDIKEEVEIGGSKSYARFVVGRTELYSRLLEGPFPDYDRVIPKSSPLNAVIQRADLMASLKRILVLSDSQTRQVKLTFGANLLKILSEYQGAGEAAEEIPIEYDGDEVTIGYNGGYLLDMLKTIQDNRVAMKFESSVSAGVFRPEKENSEEDMLCLVMPLRLPEES